MDIFSKIPRIDFMGKRRIAFAVSLTLIGITVVSPFVRKPNWGVDFAGGTEIQVQFNQDVDAGDVRRTLESAGLADVSVQVFGDPADHEFLVRAGRATLFTAEEFAKNVEPRLRDALPNLAPGELGLGYAAGEGDIVTVTSGEGETLSGQQVRQGFEAAGLRVQDVRSIVDGRSYSVLMRGVSDKVEQALKAALGEQEPQIRRVEQVGASVGNELKFSAIKSVVLAVLLILAYVGFRFDFAFGLGGVLALLHDVVIVIGFYLVTGAELNTNTIAAMLTIIGFSINDTVIIGDRIREVSAKNKGRDLEVVMNDAINDTLSRTVMTSVTVLLSLVGLIVFTGGSLRDFALAMFVGVIAGSYSSIYVANAIALWIDRRMSARKSAEKAGRGKLATGAR